MLPIKEEDRAANWIDQAHCYDPSNVKKKLRRALSQVDSNYNIRETKQGNEQPSNVNSAENSEVWIVGNLKVIMKIMASKQFFMVIIKQKSAPSEELQFN